MLSFQLQLHLQKIFVLTNLTCPHLSFNEAMYKLGTCRAMKGVNVFRGYNLRKYHAYRLTQELLPCLLRLGAVHLT